MKRLLLVDDEKNMLVVLDLLFRELGFQTIMAESAEQALEWLDRQGSGKTGSSGGRPGERGSQSVSQPGGLPGGLPGEPFDVVISDLRLPGMDGIRFLRELRRRQVLVPFILITAFGTVDKAVEVMKLGAVDVLTKPFPKEAIIETVTRSLELGKAAPGTGAVPGAAALPASQPASPSAPAAQEAPEALPDLPGLVWQSPAMAEQVGLIRKVGPFNLPVLLTGESGTGKEVVARALHGLYARDKPGRPFVSVNCPAVPEQLLESELFGYRRGAFTGASQDFRGKVEQADGGTLFFDEIGDLPMSIQPKLLRLLENRSYEALGSGQVREVDIRIVCATNRDLRALVREGRFREDLYYRINVFCLDLPPLRDRAGDILVLARHFLEAGASRLGRPVRDFSPEVARALAGYHWPGNVRELRNVVERALILSGGPLVTLADIPFELRASSLAESAIPRAASLVEPSPRPAGPLPDTASLSALDASERRLILDALECHHGNVSAAARELGITRNTLRYRMSKHGLVEIHQSEA